MPQFLPYLTGTVRINLFLVMEGYRSEKQSALQKRTVKRICDKSNRFDKRVIKNPTRLCDQKDHKSFDEAGRWRPCCSPASKLSISFLQSLHQ